MLFTIIRKTADAIPDNIDEACGVGEKEVRVKKIIYKSKYELVRHSCYYIIVLWCDPVQLEDHCSYVLKLGSCDKKA